MVRRWKATTSRRAVYEDAMPNVGMVSLGMAMRGQALFGGPGRDLRA